MTKLLTIFGAGASHDSLDDKHGTAKQVAYKPPLANQLFLKNGHFNAIIEKYPCMSATVTDIRKDIEIEIKKGGNIENVLNKKVVLSKTNPHIKNQLSEMTRYLGELLGHCSDQYVSFGSNYERFIDKLLIHDIECIFLTFNYDTLLETAIKNVTDQAYIHKDDYIHNQFPIIKAHGSWNWIKNDTDEIEVSAHMDPDSISVFGHDLCLGLPITNKHGFSCPDSHVECLKKSFADIDSIFVVGWAANDKYFLDFLSDSTLGVGKTMPVTVVGTNEESCNRIHEKIRTAFEMTSQNNYLGGFSNFMNSDAGPYLQRLGEGHIF